MAKSDPSPPKAGSRPAKQTRSRLSVDERRQQLVALGIEFFTAQPFDAVSIDDIARAAGISKGLLYHYFPTKRDFYVAAVQAAAERLLAQTETDPALPPLERLTQAMLAFLAYIAAHSASYLALLRGGMGADAEVAAIIEDVRRQFLTRVMDASVGPESSAALRVALRGWIGFVEAASLEWVEERQPDADTLAALFVAMFQAALLAGQD